MAARTVVSHLLNHLSHFPLGAGGPATFTSQVCENQENPYCSSADLGPELFGAPNLQFFILNGSTLLSCLQLRPDEDTPPGADARVRVVIRDVSGKHSWDSAVLYGPPPCSESPGGPGNGGTGPDLPREAPPLEQEEEVEEEAEPVEEVMAPVAERRCRESIPCWDSLQEAEEDEDVLDEVLHFLGSSSPECLQRGGAPLNVPAPPPCCVSEKQENDVINAILKQSAEEHRFTRRHAGDARLRPRPHPQPTPQKPASPFYYCRLLLNSLGMNSWEKR